MTGTQEEADFSFSETIDGLHGITDQKQRPAVFGLPLFGQSSDQLVLGLRRVLEFVYQQMLDAAIDGERQIGGAFGRAQSGSRTMGNLRKVDLTLLLKK